MRYERLDEQPRRRRWPWLLLVLVAALVLGAILWRWMPPGDATMARLRAVEVAYESVYAPPMPADAAVGEPLSDAQRSALETEIQTRIEACCTEGLAREHGRTARALARQVSIALARGQLYDPTFPREHLRDLQFRYRAWNGDLVFDVFVGGESKIEQLPVYDVGFVSETLRFTRVDGVWKLVEVQHFGA